MSDVDRVEVAVKQIRQVPEKFALEDVIQELGNGQLVALQALVASGRQTDAAQAAGVHPNTIRNWLNTDPFFKAAYNLWLQDTRDSIRGTLNAVAEKAAKNLEKAVEEGDRKVSYQLLKDLGHLGKQADVPTDPRVIQAQMENEIRRQAGREEGADAGPIVELLLRARRAEKRRRRERMLAAGKPQLPMNG